MISLAKPSRKQIVLVASDKRNSLDHRELRAIGGPAVFCGQRVGNLSRSPRLPRFFWAAR
jgi:hypothetical protein